MNEKPNEPSAETRNCDDCGVVVLTAQAVSYGLWKSTWFCEDCWQGLPTEQIEQLSNEVALRGVPLS